MVNYVCFITAVQYKHMNGSFILLANLRCLSKGNWIKIRKDGESQARREPSHRILAVGWATMVETTSNGHREKVQLAGTNMFL